MIDGLQVVQISTGQLIPFANNSRRHTEEQISAIASSIRQFGFLQPVIVDGRNGIVAGHARVDAAKLLGMESVPCIRAEHLSPEQIRLFVIADNRLAELSSWDAEVLRWEMADLASLGATMDWLEMPDFSDLDKETKSVTRDPDEDAPVPPHEAATVVQSGDLWSIGQHLILCGDSTNPEHVERVLAGAKPLLCVTDPPYGVEYEPKWRQERLGGSRRAVGIVSNDDKIDWEKTYKLFPGNVLYVWHAGKFTSDVALGLKLASYEIRNQIVWVKNNFAISRGHYHWKHEDCAYAVRKGEKANWQGDRSQTTVWEVPMLNTKSGRENEKTGHSTQKPVELFARPYRNHCKPGEHVYEPFCGSGTAMAAAHVCELVCHAIELLPAYVEAALVRMERLTGMRATHVETGLTLEDLRLEAAAAR